MLRGRRAPAQPTEPASSQPGTSEDHADVQVLLVERMNVVRAALRLLIDGEAGMSVVADTGDADEGLSLIRARPRKERLVVVVAIGLTGDHDAFWLIRRVREEFPTVSVLACGANSDEMDVSRALFVGADGFVDKDADPAELVSGIRAAATGEMVLAGIPASWVGEIAAGIDRSLESTLVLTAREREVLNLLAEGLTARQMGARLGIRERTVTTHLSRIYRKLRANGRVAAINAAARAGLVSLGTW
jgi:DNA-binding NarL/FixJ family response regulator